MRFTRKTSQSDFAGELIFDGAYYNDGPLPACALLVFKFDTNQDWDSDGVVDALDTCPVTASTGQENRDSDEHGDVCDLCPDYGSANNLDSDGNNIGDVCECGDQNSDGTVNVADILAINGAIFNPRQASPLCDTNFDGKCNVQDIIGANQKIFGGPAYCSRYPPPGS